VASEFLPRDLEVVRSAVVNVYFLSRALSPAGGISRPKLSVERRVVMVFYQNAESHYSLVGIFDVNMPLLYGEGGTKAFLRLQHESIKTSTYGTICAWVPPQIISTDRLLQSVSNLDAAIDTAKSMRESNDPDCPSIWPLLAPSPQWYQFSSKCVRDVLAETLQHFP